MKRTLALVLLVAGAFGSQESTEPAPLTAEQCRDVVTTMAGLLRENYVFADVAEEIAGLIEGKLESGEYASIVTKQGLASVLTADLRSINDDRHLGLWVVPERTPGEDVDGDNDEESGGGYDYSLTHGRNTNYGFEEVRVLAGNVGYIRMKNFSMDELYAQAARAASAALAMTSNTDALIFDLRDNPGGGARLPRYLASYLFDAETPVHLNDYYFRRTDETLEYWTLDDLPGERRPECPVFILINAGTFSAAEGFAYNLKHLGRATIVGVTSGGGAHGGSSHLLGHGLEGYVPHSRSIHPVTQTDFEGVGVLPDVETASDRALYFAHVAAVEGLSELAQTQKQIGHYADVLAKLKR